MTAGGWIVMLASVGGVVTLLIWCIYKLLTIPGETGHVHGFERTPSDEDMGSHRHK